jgi:protoporphyrin/coproporphyrin ferrochelatase
MNEPTQPNSAILLLAHGTPDVLSEMAPYLDKVTSGRPMPAAVIAELQHRYAEIGLQETPLTEGPPLTRWTLLQAQLLSEHLGQKVYVGMRNWHPFIAGTVAQMIADGVTHARVLCLAPQNSRTSTGLYRKALEAALASAEHPFTFTFTAGWSGEPLLAQAFAERLAPTLAAAPPNTPVLFTAHAVPCRTIMSSTPEPTRPNTPVPPDGIQNYGPASAPDPYPAECKQTALRIANLLGLTDANWFFAFQSQGIVGAPWLGPTVPDTLAALAAQGHQAVVLQPVGFLCDHVEILYDIDIDFKNQAAALGLQLSRAPSLNDSPTLTRALTQVLSTFAFVFAFAFPCSSLHYSLLSTLYSLLL